MKTSEDTFSHDITPLMDTQYGSFQVSPESKSSEDEALVVSLVTVAVI